MCFISILKINGQVYIIIKTEIETFAAFVFEKKMISVRFGGPQVGECFDPSESIEVLSLLEKGWN